MRKLLSVFLISITVLLAGCGNTSTSSSSGAAGIELSRAENTIQTGSGELVYVVYDSRGTAGEAVRVKVKIRDADNNPIPGTLHWGDNSANRVFNGTLIRHEYQSAGTYTFAVQPDEGEKVAAGTIVIVPAPVVPEPDAGTGTTGPRLICEELAPPPGGSLPQGELGLFVVSVSPPSDDVIPLTLTGFCDDVLSVGPGFLPGPLPNFFVGPGICPVGQTFLTITSAPGFEDGSCSWDIGPPLMGTETPSGSGTPQYRRQ